MREQIDETRLEEVTGGVINYSWNKDTQKGYVSSSVTGQTYYFGADTANAVYKYVMAHRNDPEADQMAAIRSIIG